jgi:hypothetical protein
MPIPPLLQSMMKNRLPPGGMGFQSLCFQLHTALQELTHHALSFFFLINWSLIWVDITPLKRTVTSPS